MGGRGKGKCVSNKLLQFSLARKVHESRDSAGGWAKIVLNTDEVHTICDMLEGGGTADGKQVNRKAATRWFTAFGKKNDTSFAGNFVPIDFGPNGVDRLEGMNPITLALACSECPALQACRAKGE